MITDEKIKALVRKSFGEPVLAVEDQIRQLIEDEKRELLTRILGDPDSYIEYSHKQDNFACGLGFMQKRIRDELNNLQGESHE